MKKKFRFNPNWLTYLAIIVLVFSIFFHFTGQLGLNILSLAIASILFLIEFIIFSFRDTVDVGSLILSILAILCALYTLITFYYC